jgi:hypothetical protein
MGILGAVDRAGKLAIDGGEVFGGCMAPRLAGVGMGSVRIWGARNCHCAGERERAPARSRKSVAGYFSARVVAVQGHGR